MQNRVAWMMLDAPHYNINNIPTEKFDLGIVIIPKNNPNIDLNLFRSCCDKVTIIKAIGSFKTILSNNNFITIIPKLV